MTFIDKLFAFGSVPAAIAGITEIEASRNRWIKNEKQNMLTPLCMMFVKALRIPKFAILAKTTTGNVFPLISAVGALIIWSIAFIYTILPPSHHNVHKVPQHLIDQAISDRIH